MTRSIAAVLDDAIATLRRSRVLLESAVVHPAPEPAALAEAERIAGPLSPWVVEAYAQIGGAHIAWRLERYDVSGNLDLLSLGEICHGLTGHGWQRSHGDRAQGYRPVDFASHNLSLGFDAEGGPVLLDLVEDRRVPLAMTLPAYLEAGAALWFLDGWQLSLLGDAEAGRESERLAARVRQLSGE